MVTVHELTGEDWSRWRSLRLRAVSDAPQAFRATLKEESGRTHADWEAIIRATAGHDRGNAWMAQQDGEDVGMAFARIDQSLTTTSIAAMWVAPAARGQGVGTALLEGAVRWGMARGARITELWVAESNAGAVAFYEACGFDRTDETERLRPGSELTVRKYVRTA